MRKKTKDGPAPDQAEAKPRKPWPVVNRDNLEQHLLDEWQARHRLEFQQTALANRQRLLMKILAGERVRIVADPTDLEDPEIGPDLRCLIAAAESGNKLQPVTLNQMAGLCHCSKRKMQRHKSGEHQPALPLPDIVQGDGRPNLWHYHKVRPVLERIAGHPLPQRLPTGLGLS
ncbi:MAG: hypothetical protein ACYS0G_05175 [Planctomycetota bacterium]|jgi:hypothetical protein